MNKYIDADKLIAELKRQKHELELSIQSQGDYGQSCHIVAYENVLSLITSLQQEQPEVQNGKFVFPKYLYARTKDNKTIDMSYVPQDTTAVEYIRNDFVEQEQPKDLASLINEATNVAKRIVDRNSFYNSLPQNLQNKYTSEAWCEILEALSTMKAQVQPEADLEKEIARFALNGGTGDNTPTIGETARHFYELGLNDRTD